MAVAWSTVASVILTEVNREIVEILRDGHPEAEESSMMQLGSGGGDLGRGRGHPHDGNKIQAGP